MVDVNLDVNAFADEVPSGPIPAGRYTVMIAGSVLRDTSTGGKMVVMDFAVDEGQFKGRHLFENLNLWHSNPKVSEISKRQLANIAKSCGFSDVLRRTEELNGRRLVVQVDVDGEYNTVKRHFALAPAGGLLGRAPVSGIVPQPTPPEVSPANLTGQNQPFTNNSNPPWV